MVSILADEQSVFGQEGHRIGELELSDLGALLTEDGDDSGLAFSPIDDLDPMVARVSHPEQTLFVDGQRLGAAELQGCISVLSHSVDEFSVGRVLVDTVVFTVFAQVDCSVRSASKVGNPAELAWLGSIDATDRSRFDKLSVGGIKEELKVVGIDHDECVGFRVEGHSGGFAVGPLGGFPSAQELSVGIEGLDARGFVDDVEFVVGADGQRSGFLESSVGQSALADDQIDAARG